MRTSVPEIAGPAFNVSQHASPSALPSGLGWYVHFSGKPDRRMSKAYSVCGNGVITKSVSPLTEGDPACPRGLPVRKTSTGRSVETFAADICWEPARAGASAIRHAMKDGAIKLIEAKLNAPKRPHLRLRRSDIRLCLSSPISEDLQ